MKPGYPFLEIIKFRISQRLNLSRIAYSHFSRDLRGRACFIFIS